MVEVLVNQKELETIRRKNLNLLDIAYRPKINAVEVNINNSAKHEQTKFYCLFLLRRGLPANYLPEYIKENTLEENISSWDMQQDTIYWNKKIKHEWQRPQVVTEARFKLPSGFTHSQRCKYLGVCMCKTRRADIFILDTGEIVEIETDKKIKKKGDNVITVYI